MKVCDPGHAYLMNCLDSKSTWESLTFVKRCGDGYPGNERPPFAGTNIQEVLRCLIHRTQYLDNQKYYWVNPICVFLYRVCINLLEYRAAKRHSRKFRLIIRIEELPFNSEDGHIRF